MPEADAGTADRDSAQGPESDAAHDAELSEPPGDAGDPNDAAADGGATTDLDASVDTPDAAPPIEPNDAGGDPEPIGYVPDPITIARELPAVVPVLRFSLGGQQIMKDVEISGTLEVFEDHSGTLDDLDSRTPTLMTQVGFQGRGNFTWSLPKQGYAFELQDARSEAVDQALLGLPAGSDFALYACYTDKTCLRNALVFALGQRLGRWSPRTRYVELVIDDQYRGLYMVWERIRRDDARLVLEKPATASADGDLSGGYVIRVEGPGKGTTVEAGVTYPRDFTTSSGRIYTYHYPDAQKISEEQALYIRDQLQALEDALAGDPVPHEAWVDLPSWADRGIVEELTNNWDGYVHSVYMVKRPAANGGKFEMGPLWDFDLAFANGNVNGYNCRTDTWAYQNVRPAPDDIPPYWLALYAEPDFQRAWKCRYRELRGGALDLATLDAQIDAWIHFTEQARARDQALWQTIGQQIFPNCDSAPDYAGEVADLRSFIQARLAWLDARAAEMPGRCDVP